MVKEIMSEENAQPTEIDGLSNILEQLDNDRICEMEFRRRTSSSPGDYYYQVQEELRSRFPDIDPGVLNKVTHTNPVELYINKMHAQSPSKSPRPSPMQRKFLSQVFDIAFMVQYPGLTLPSKILA